MKHYFRAYGRSWHRAQLGLQATSLSYSTVLSIVPLLAVFLSLSKASGHLYVLIEKFKDLVLANMTIGTAQDFTAGLSEAVAKLNGQTIGTVGFFVTVLTSVIILSTIDVAIQRIWGITRNRHFVKRLIVYILIILTGPLGAALLLSFSSSPYSLIGPLLPSSVLSTLYLWLFLFLINKLVPNCKVRLKSAFIASALTAVSFLILQVVFLWATKHLLNYNEVYGSLASIPLFLFWLFLVWYIIFMGVVLCATLSRGDSEKMHLGTI